MVKLTYRPPAYGLWHKKLAQYILAHCGHIAWILYFKACYAGTVWVSESVPVWAPQLSGHLVHSFIIIHHRLHGRRGSLTWGIHSLKERERERQATRQTQRWTEHTSLHLGLPDCCIPNTGDFFNHVNVCSYVSARVPTFNNKKAVLSRVFWVISLPTSFTGLSLLLSVPVKILRTNELQYWKLPLSTAVLSFDAPFSLDATLVNIRIKFILSECLHFWQW